MADMEHLTIPHDKKISKCKVLHADGASGASGVALATGGYNAVSASLLMPVCVPPEPAITVDIRSNLAPTSWADLDAAEEEENAGLAAGPVDLRPELRDQDLVAPIWIVHLDQIDLVTVGIVRAYRTHHSFISIWA